MFSIRHVLRNSLTLDAKFGSFTVNRGLFNYIFHFCGAEYHKTSLRSAYSDRMSCRLIDDLCANEVCQHIDNVLLDCDGDIYLHFHLCREDKLNKTSSPHARTHALTHTRVHTHTHTTQFKGYQRAYHMCYNL